MAKLGDLVVRIGADTRGLNKSLGKVQRNMRSMTSNFTKLGTSMTKSITLPLLGIAAMAVKSAADLEKMETGFISLAGGASEAAAMMKQLNDFTAKTPFQIEAVATAARQLIASGTGIGEVNEQLQFLGDIAATTGQPINEIAAIFAKVNAKGKVELENLNQLAERGIPVFKGLADATGLLPSELGAGAVTVQQFNDYLKGLSKEGGFAEGAMERLSQTASGKFSTALDNLKLAGASLAESLLPILSDLLDYVVDLAQSFVDLSPSTKKMILIFGGVAAALGPLLVIIPQIIAGLPLITSAFVAMTGPIGLAVIGVTALIGTVAALVKANKDIPSTLERANAFVRDHSTEVRYLVGQYKDETKSLEDRKRILGRLATIDATHFGNLTAENTTYNDLVKNLDNYTASLRKNYLEKSFAEQGSALFGTLADDEAAINDKRATLQEAIDIEANANRFTREATKKNRIQIEGELQALQDQRDQTLINIESFEKEKLRLLEKYATPDIPTPTDETGAATAPVVVIPVPDTAPLKKAVDDITGFLFELQGMGTTTFQTLSNGIQDFVVSSTPQLLAFLDDFSVAVENTAEVVADSVKNMADDINGAISAGVASMITGVAEMVGTAIGAQKPIENMGAFLGNALGQMAINLGTYAIAHGTVIEAIKKSLIDLGGVKTVLAGIALVALGAGIKGHISRSASDAGIPALAEGGLAYGPTLAMVGDNKGANIDPEVVAPLSKLKGMLGGNTVQVYGRISGDDIVISNSRASRDRNRF
jgi:tape measure domain-containing protein